jgi:hypothetical protein
MAIEWSDVAWTERLILKAGCLSARGDGDTIAADDDSP